MHTPIQARGQNRHTSNWKNGYIWLKIVPFEAWFKSKGQLYDNFLFDFLRNEYDTLLFQAYVWRVPFEQTVKWD